MLAYYAVIYRICSVLASNLWHASIQYATHLESQSVTLEFKIQKTLSLFTILCYEFIFRNV
jgi:hypothetical protein